ncbi:transposase IS66, partial [mine drainage metagenome]
MAGWHALGLTHSRIQMLLESDYGQKISLGAVDKMLARAGKLFAPAVEAITKAIQEGREVVVDNTGWRVDGVNHFLWDFIAPEIKAALFVVDRSGGHQVPERVLPGNRKQTVVCDGGKCFNPLKGKKRIQRDWVHIRRHAKEGLVGYETVADAPDWRWLKSAKAAADAVLRAARLPMGKERDRKVVEVRRRVERLLRREVEGEPARKLKKYLLGRSEELWTWVGTGGLAQSNAAEQGLRFHIAGKRKVSGGSRTMVGAARTAGLASVQATARMRSVRFAEVGHRLLRGNAEPVSPGAGTP